MNGVHDMGGMHGMGPIQYEKNEPVFHELWESRAFALQLAMAFWGKWSIDASRHQRELIPPAEYLRMSYYKKWIAGLVELLVKSDLVTPAEIESGAPAPNSPKAIPALAADKVPPLMAQGGPASRDVPVVARFQMGQRVRTRNMHPVGHTRLPRYARKARHDRSGSRCLCLPGHERPFPRREAAARLLSALRHVRALGRAGHDARRCLSRPLGGLP